jgi:transposase-like protein
VNNDAFWYRQVNCQKLIESAHEYLQTSPIPSRYHFLRSLAVLPLQSQARGNSHRDIEDLLAERGITVSREAIRLWCIKFGAIYTRRLKRKHRGYGDTFFIDEVYIKINGKQHYLWRAVDQDGEVVDVYLQPRRDGAAVTTRQLNASSKGYCVLMEASPVRS